MDRLPQFFYRIEVTFIDPTDWIQSPETGALEPQSNWAAIPLGERTPWIPVNVDVSQGSPPEENLTPIISTAIIWSPYIFAYLIHNSGRGEEPLEWEPILFHDPPGQDNQGPRTGVFEMCLTTGDAFINSRWPEHFALPRRYFRSTGPQQPCLLVGPVSLVAALIAMKIPDTQSMIDHIGRHFRPPNYPQYLPPEAQAADDAWPNRVIVVDVSIPSMDDEQARSHLQSFEDGIHGAMLESAG